jgi:hypothetical protein
MDLTMMERVGDRKEKMEGSCSTGQSPQWVVVPVEEEEEEGIHVTLSARSRNHCCRGKAMGITYFKYVPVALGIQHAKRIRGLSSSTIFLHFTS